MFWWDHSVLAEQRPTSTWDCSRTGWTGAEIIGKGGGGRVSLAWACQSWQRRLAGRWPATVLLTRTSRLRTTNRTNTQAVRHSFSLQIYWNTSSLPFIVESGWTPLLKIGKEMFLMRKFPFRNAWRKWGQVRTYIVTWYKPEIENVYKSYKGRERHHHHYGPDQWCGRQKCRGNKNQFKN